MSLAISMTYRPHSKNVIQQSHFHWIAQRDWSAAKKIVLTWHHGGHFVQKTQCHGCHVCVPKKSWRNCSHVKTFFFPPKNLHSCWPREGKGCIPILCNWLKNQGEPFSTNQKKTKIHRYNMITYDSYNRSLGSTKRVQRTHHYCFDSDFLHSRGFGLRLTQTPNTASDHDIQCIKRLVSIWSLQ